MVLDLEIVGSVEQETCNYADWHRYAICRDLMHSEGLRKQSVYDKVKGCRKTADNTVKNQIAISIIEIDNELLHITTLFLLPSPTQ